MGVPKRLTEMQMNFAHEVISNEGRKNGFECAIDAGYSKDRARVTASELQNPRKYPLKGAIFNQIFKPNHLNIFS